MPSSTTARRLTAPVNPDVTTHGSFRRGMLAGAGAVLGLVLLAGLVAVLVTAGRTASTDPTRQLADRIRAQDAARNTQQVKALTAQARDLATRLASVLRQMEAAMPHEGRAPQPAGAAEAGRWKAVTSTAVAALAHPPSGDTGNNVARSDFAAAVRALDSAVDSYRLALGAPDSLAKRLTAAAASQRDQGIDVWSIGATELDAIDIHAGLGHQHVFLQVAPDGQALTPDDQPEGSGGR
ncbi:hypothetical protein ACFW1F_30685 [Streptomyces bungoensis]|uniref:hypothetical protein n=1 Tax=Streptomyces bungoensis TaxID=285568 RepID=UPI0036B8ED4B